MTNSESSFAKKNLDVLVVGAGPTGVTAAADSTVRHLCDELDATMTEFPGTDLRVVYELVSTQNPWGQEV